jgi:hypothetical protein
MKRAFTVAVAAASILLVACSARDDGNVITIRPEDLTPDASVTIRTAEPTKEAVQTPAPSGESVEVQGIIGAIDKAAGTITITRLQGADLDTIRVVEDTEIRSAGGRLLTLVDLRPSDRIVANGVIEGGAMTAARIAVGQVVPGANPGG